MSACQVDYVIVLILLSLSFPLNVKWTALILKSIGQESLSHAPWYSEPTTNKYLLAQARSVLTYSTGQMPQLWIPVERVNFHTGELIFFMLYDILKFVG